ncbi:MAG: DUF2752 domain-containing protein [Bacteroidota bacterium]
MTSTRLGNVILKIEPEAWIWLLALLYMGLMNPTADSHFSLCLFKNLGFKYCPGCGLGHSISFLLHGQFAQSFHSHPLGIAAVPILIHRIITLIRPSVTKSILFTS